MEKITQKLPEFGTIREVAAKGVLKESALRVLHKANLLPGFSIGSRCYINIDILCNMLRDPNELSRINDVLSEIGVNKKEDA